MIEGREKGVKVQLEEEVLLNLDDVTRVEIRTQEERVGEFDVAVVFTPRAAAEFYKVTANNIGRRLAVLVDCELTMTPTIMQPVSRGLLYYNIPEQEARSKVDMINEFLQRRR